MNALKDKLGLVDSEKFISLIQKEKFDYTKWRENILEDLSLDDLSSKAMNYYKKNNPSSVKKKKSELVKR
jgi:hypothetical protein